MENKNTLYNSNKSKMEQRMKIEASKISRHSYSSNTMTVSNLGLNITQKVFCLVCTLYQSVPLKQTSITESPKFPMDTDSPPVLIDRNKPISASPRTSSHGFNLTVGIICVGHSSKLLLWGLKRTHHSLLWSEWITWDRKLNLLNSWNKIKLTIEE